MGSSEDPSLVNNVDELGFVYYVRINQAVSLFRAFFVRFDENVDANLSYWQNAQKYL